MRAFCFSCLALLLTAACGGEDPDAMEFREVGPEQSTFLVTPADPLVIPQPLALPQPTPNGVNRAEQ
ncbi:MAG: hypothetical protein ACSHW1_08605 [Yoonia sp.]|uniref:hypothetical protein n=1 Tax=Yoonia sp. TaxID=2212373 RepID=UPI003EFA59C8